MVLSLLRAFADGMAIKEKNCRVGSRRKSPIRLGRAALMRKWLLLASAIFAVDDATADDPQCTRERAAMVDTIRAYTRTDVGFSAPQSISERVLDAVGQTQRHRFMPRTSCANAYTDGPATIGYGQTISQPYIVALMTQLAQVEANHTVLEIGTGSGYQAAVLARLAQKVCTIEIVRPLAETAAKVLRELGYANVEVRIGDGYHGWPECGPFDAVVVTAALGHVPPALIEQLKVGGRIVMPVGQAGATQRLTVIDKIAPGETATRSVALVRFVPFIRSRD
jgi:protein-L-isoaspartate(D-aspartate) O-methyltransferase